MYSADYDYNFFFFRQLSRISSSEKFNCVVRETVKDALASSKKKQFLEIWQNDLLFKNFDVEELNVHGSIYFDGRV